jgi:UDP-N-acetylglucosamine--N-acetylmuramyl-(pentapeptide) pyrophosphoryl-undecaprenol N-acetylglucosamine transferase
MAPLADRITVVFEKSLADYQEKAVLTGNPVAVATNQVDLQKAFLDLGLDQARPLIFAFGGGTGATGINRVIADALPVLLSHCQVVLATGKGKTGVSDVSLRQEYMASGYRELEFLDHRRLLETMAASQLVISRAGLGAFTDLASLAKPAIIIPLPGSHQEDNAEAFSEAGAIICVNQSELSGDVLAKMIISLLSDQAKLSLLSEKIAVFNHPEACAELAKVADLAKRKD